MKSLNVRIGEQSVRRQFSKRAGTFNGSASWITDPRLVDAHVKAAGKPAGRAVELCCGTGVIGKALSAAGWDIVGVDLSREMLAEAGRHFPVLECNVERLPFSDSSFDLAVMRQALFFTDASKTLKEAARVLKRGGRFVLSQTVPFSAVDCAWLERVHLTKQADMLKFYTAGGLEEKLAENGFRVVDKDFLRVRESITRWMRFAPELADEQKMKVCDLIRDAPEGYRKLRRVAVEGDELMEDWNWVIYAAINDK